MVLINHNDPRISKIQNTITIDRNYDLFVFSLSIGNYSKSTIEFYTNKKNTIVVWFAKTDTLRSNISENEAIRIK